MFFSVSVCLKVFHYFTWVSFPEALGNSAHHYVTQVQLWKLCQTSLGLAVMVDTPDWLFAPEKCFCATELLSQVCYSYCLVRVGILFVSLTDKNVVLNNNDPCCSLDHWKWHFCTGCVVSSVPNGSPPSLLSLDLAVDYHKDHLILYVMLHGIGRDKSQDHFLNSFSFFLGRRKDQNYDYEVHVIWDFQCNWNLALSL